MIIASECFRLAILELVRSTPIKQRLVSAYRRYLAPLTLEQIPLEVRDSFGQIMHSLSGVQPLRGEDAVAASVRKMSNQEADECAALIVEIFGSMCNSHLSSARVDNVVQLHAVERAEEFDAPALTASH